jgi:RNA polymerase sigma-70 factor (ECF subfamily)
MTDEEIIREVLSGKNDRFGILFERYGTRVYRFIFKFLHDPEAAEDVAQETFVQAFSGLARFQGRSKFSTWLFGISYNLTLRHIQQSRLRGVVSSAEAISTLRASKKDSPLYFLEKKRTVSALVDTVDSLPDELRYTFILIFLEGISYAEAAELMDTPIGTVRSRVHRTREILGEKLKLHGLLESNGEE